MGSLFDGGGRGRRPGRRLRIVSFDPPEVEPEVDFGPPVDGPVSVSVTITVDGPGAEEALERFAENPEAVLSAELADVLSRAFGFVPIDEVSPIVARRST